MPRQDWSSAFANANDAEVSAMDDSHGKVRQQSAERKRRQESGAAGTEDDDGLNSGRIHGRWVLEASRGFVQLRLTSELQAAVPAARPGTIRLMVARGAIPNSFAPSGPQCSFTCNATERVLNVDLR